MRAKIAINGLGRIGHGVLRAIYEADSCHRPGLKFKDCIEPVLVNELASPQQLYHSIKYDSTHGRFSGELELKDDQLTIGGDIIKLSNERHPMNMSWESYHLSALLECSGSFADRKTAEQYLDAGAQKLIFSHPASSDIDKTIVFGVNQNELSATDSIISSASCTTNAVIPVLAILQKQFTIQRGTITTIHSTMNDQRLIDTYNPDWRKSRSALHSIIPVHTALERGISRIFPHFEGRFTAQAIRVPTANVSAINLVLNIKEKTDYATVNCLLENAANNELKGIVGISYEPLVSVDFNHDSRSSIIDAHQTLVSDHRLISLLIWFDNEWAYACRMLDTLLALLDKNKANAEQLK